MFARISYLKIGNLSARFSHGTGYSVIFLAAVTATRKDTFSDRSNKDQVAPTQRKRC